MKCIKYVGSRNTGGEDIRRVPEEIAAKMVADIHGWWTYCPKAEWKAQQKKEG